MASGSYNTMNEWLSKCTQDLTQALTCADADIPFITDLITQMVGKQREPVDAQAQNPNVPGINPGPGLPGSSPLPPMPGGMPGGMPTPPGGGGIPMGGGAPPMVPGLSQQSSVNPGELQRLLAGPQ